MQAFLISLCLLLPSETPQPGYYVIRNATIYDGTEKPGQKGDLAIEGERIVAVGTFKIEGNPTIIDGTGLIVTPGFIDLHTHSDRPIVEPATRANLNYLLQGVTTIVTGNCGAGPVDTADFLKKIEEGKVGTNVAHQIPHNDLRRQVMGNANRAPKPEEMTRMKELADRAMKDGAWGLSTGLYYTPGSYATTDEIVELAKTAAENGGFYASHMRDEGADLLTSVRETLEIGKRAKIPVHISHMKAYSKRGWGKAADAIGLVEKARAEGQVATADQYPYVASSTSLAADFIPTVFREGSQKDLLDRIDDPEQGPKVKQAIERLLADAEDGKRVRIARYGKRPDWQGKDLNAIARAEKKSPLEIVLEIERNGGSQIVNFSMQEEEIRLIMKQTFVATASDGSARTPDAELPHPRLYGCFAHKIGRFAIEDRIVTIEHAVRSASGLPADILRLPERGYLRKGYFADVVVLDPNSYRDTATFDHPQQYATGLRYLFINGVPAVVDGKFTGELAGRALRHMK